MLRVNAINRQELLKCLTLIPKVWLLKQYLSPSATLFVILTFLYFLFFDIIDKSITFVAETVDTWLHFGLSAAKETIAYTNTTHISWTFDY